MRLAHLIKSSRQELGIAQKLLAERIGVSPQYLNDIEQRSRHPKSDILAEKLAVELSLAPDLLYFAMGILPPDVRAMRGQVSETRIVLAYSVMRDMLRPAK